MRFSLAVQFLGLVLVPLALSSPLAERNTCSDDTLSNLFQKHYHEAELFCFEYIHYPTKTITVNSPPATTVTRIEVSTTTKVVDHFTTTTGSVTTTKTKQSTITETSTATSDITDTLTSVSTTTGTVSSTSTFDLDSTSTSEIDTTTTTEIDITITSEIDAISTTEIDITITSDATTTTVTGVVSTSDILTTTTGFQNQDRRMVQKRGEDPWKFKHPPPAPTGKYGARQLSSACSCLSITVTTTSTVAVEPSTYTKVIHSVKTITSAKAVTEKKTKTATSTATSLDTTTEDVTSTSTSLTTVQSTESDTTTTTSTTTFTSDTTTSFTSTKTSFFTSDTTTSFTSSTTTFSLSLTTTTTNDFTKTDTSTSTTTTTTTACPTPTGFYLAITSNDDGTYFQAQLALQDTAASIDDTVYVASDIGRDPTPFTLGATGLTDPAGRIAKQNPGSAAESLVLFYSAADSTSADFVPLVCTLHYRDSGACVAEVPFTCTGTNGNPIFSYCPQQGMGLYIGSAVQSGCEQVTVDAIAISS